MGPKKKTQIKACKAGKAARDTNNVSADDPPPQSKNKPKGASSISKSKQKAQPKQTKHKQTTNTPVKSASPQKGRTRRPIKKSETPSPPQTKRIKGVKSAPKNKQQQPTIKSPTKSEPKKQQSPNKGKGKKKDTTESDKKPNKDESKIKKQPDNPQQPQQTDKMVTQVVKGDAAVDSQVPNKDSYRVYSDPQKCYTATLNQANCQDNNNKFYIAQVLVHQTTGVFYVWNRWGRNGKLGQNTLKGPLPKAQAIKQYNEKVRDKTVKGDYIELQIRYDKEEESEQAEDLQTKKENKTVSTMDPELQKFINLIFDMSVVKNTIKEIGYNAKKMPLGKLGEGTIKKAYEVLNKLSEAIKNGQTSQFSKLSSSFYTLIPHDFGFDKMQRHILSTEDQVKQKIKMLEAISDMKVTVKLLKESTNEDVAVSDQNYKKLGCNIKVLKRNSEEYKLLSEYFNNTKGNYSRVTIGDIFEIERPTEMASFNSKLGNNMLLWHGSGIANFVGILSQGMRIAPPEAPASGYLFGKGIYLADLAEKSIGYCRANCNSKALILLIEGALGTPNLLLTTSCQAKQLMEKNGKNSTKCCGTKAPPESSHVNLKGMIVPNGKAEQTNSGSYMQHNEFIVYNINQARIRYVIEMDMN